MGTTESSSDLSTEQLETLLKDPKSTTEFRILQAARRLLARDGLGISIEAIAAEADLGRRTIFRYFATRDELVARALSESLSRFHAQVADTLSESTDFDEWLHDIVRTLLISQSSAGRGLWQLAASDDVDLPPAIAAVNAQRRQARQLLTRSMAHTAWTKMGQTNDVPRSVELAFALAISSFAVHSLDVDYESSSDESIDAVVALLSATLKAARQR